MREIKFRGKTINEGKWVYGLLTDVTTTPEQGQIAYEDNDGWTGDIVDLSTLGQYTGIKDSKGRRIFEGDILSVLGSFNQKGMLTNFHVEYVEKKGAFGMLLEAGGFVSVASLFKVRGLETDVVITGNIHDNPELLKGGEE